MSADLIAGAAGILLDFDGPVCSIFTRPTAAEVADRLLRLVHDAGVRLSGDVGGDPLQVLRLCATEAPELVGSVGEALTAAESDAARAARPNFAAHAFLTGCADRGQPVAIVSNNSAVAVHLYLDTAGLRDYVGITVGRPWGRPHLMKPHPHSLLEAAGHLGIEPQRLVMIGDSESDMLAALAAGVTPVGFANKPGKGARLAAAGARLVLDGNFGEI